MYRQNCKVKQNPICCVFCGKEYTQRRSLNNHMILCEDLTRIHQGKRPYSKPIIDEKNIPTNEVLNLQIIQLTQKCNQLEERVKMLEKTSGNLENNKNKINLNDWLKVHRKESSYFDNIQEHLKGPSTESIFGTSFAEVAQQILLDCVEENQKNIKGGTSLIACIEKINKVYIHTRAQDWRLIKTEDIYAILNKIQMDCIKSLNVWKKYESEKSSTLSLSDELSSKYNKTMIKILNTNCRQESFSRKLITHIYNQIKQPMVSIIEQD